MRLLGLELSDAGIVVAAQQPAGLLQIDGRSRESPGFAVPHKKQLLVGQAAANQAHLRPRQMVNRFWDQLNVEPLKQPLPQAQNHAEIACAHLAQIWDIIKPHGDALVMAVPGFFTREQLGLILGIAQELSMPLQGFISLAVAAARQPCPECLLLHLDMHLHRSEMAVLEQGERLTPQEAVTTTGKGLQALYAEWVKAIAEEFVRATRFDPLHHAVYEQEVYDRLPHILATLQEHPTVPFEITAGRKTYQVTLSRELLVDKSQGVFWHLRRLLTSMHQRYGNPGQAVTIQVTHRVSCLPGYQEMVAEMPDAQVIELEAGSGAFGALLLWEDMASTTVGQSVSLFTSRPWPTAMSPATPRQATQAAAREASRATHVLYRNLAYAISEQPLKVGSGEITTGVGVRIQGEPTDVARYHCSLQRRGDDVVLTDHSTSGTYVDNTRVSGSCVVQLGQMIRVGTSGETLQLIACVEADDA